MRRVSFDVRTRKRFLRLPISLHLHTVILTFFCVTFAELTSLARDAPERSAFRLPIFPRRLTHFTREPHNVGMDHPEFFQGRQVNSMSRMGLGEVA